MEETTVCINIGRGQRRIRYLGALAAALVVVGLFVFLIGVGASRWWRLILAAPIWIAVLSYAEAANRTCIQLAGRNEQSLDDGMIISKTLQGDKIQDQALSKALRYKARLILRQGAIVTTILMTVILVLPVGS